MNTIDGILNKLSELERRIAHTESISTPRWARIAAPLTAAAWDGGDDFSTTAKTKIDLSAVFNTPAGIRRINVNVSFRDSGSAGADCYIILSPNNTAGSGWPWRAHGRTNDAYESHSDIVNCDANGDIYYQILATGANTANVYIAILDYEI